MLKKYFPSTLFFLLTLVFQSGFLQPPPEARVSAPLRVHSSNPRYVMDATGKAIYLTGSHERNNFQLSILEKDLSVLDFDAYLKLLRRHNHNFIRLWSWEDARWTPLPYLRTGPGTANDGKPKFDVSRFNQEYFDELRSRVVAARKRGIYVGVMLFQGWSIMKESYEPGYMAWDFHPLHENNNVNGLRGDADRDGEGEEVHTLEIPAITELQKDYARKVIDTLNDLDNVIWEISNESPVGSTDWQYEMIAFVKDYESRKTKQHLVWMTSTFPSQGNSILFDSPADVVSPRADAAIGLEYLQDPPVDASKIVVNDTDHFGATTNELQLIWKSFTRGLNPIILDGRLNGLPFPLEQKARAAMGHTRRYAEKINLAAMHPRPTLSSTAYILANPGAEYLAYQPGSGPFTVDLEKADYTYEWFDPDTGLVVARGSLPVEAGRWNFVPPFSGPAVLYLSSARINNGVRRR